MAYTTQQQAQIDAAKLKWTNATTAYNNAVGVYDSNYSFFCAGGNWKIMNDCNSSFHPQNCADAIQAGINGLSPSCNGRGGGDCIRESTCKSRVSEWKTYASRMAQASLDKDFAKTAMDTAKTEYDTILENIGTEVANDPQNQLDLATATAEAEAEGKTLKTKWLIFGILAVVLIIGIGFFYFKVLKK